MLVGQNSSILTLFAFLFLLPKQTVVQEMWHLYLPPPYVMQADKNNIQNSLLDIQQIDLLL